MNYSATQVYDVVSYTVSSRTNFLLEKKKKKKKKLHSTSIPDNEFKKS